MSWIAESGQICKEDMVSSRPLLSRPTTTIRTCGAKYYGTVPSKTKLHNQRHALLVHTGIQLNQDQQCELRPAFLLDPNPPNSRLKMPIRRPKRLGIKLMQFVCLNFSTLGGLQSLCWKSRPQGFSPRLITDHMNIRNICIYNIYMIIF